MAAQPMATTGAEGNPAMDYEAHYATYKTFTTMVKWGTATVVLILILLAYLTL